MTDSVVVSNGVMWLASRVTRMRGVVVLAAATLGCNADLVSDSVPAIADDHNPPVWRDGVVSIDSIGERWVSLSWTPATDDSGSVEYELVYLHGRTTVTGTHALVSGLAPGMEHEFALTAYDPARNHSETRSARARTRDACTSRRLILPTIVEEAGR